MEPKKYMPRTVAFTKMQGLGNDYVYINAFEERDIPDPAALAVRISDRNFGVGGDGLVLVCPSEHADVRMRMFNADGSEGEMCGNASRCIGKFVYEKGIVRKESITLETLAGIRILNLTIESGRVSQVEVDMGKPIFEPAQIPVNADGTDFINQPVEAAGKIWLGTAVSMGNPHIVIPVETPVAELDLATIGPMFENHELFPKRINTEFANVLGRNKIAMRVWERGSGETLACGTGACATLVACARNGLTDREATIELRGGNLHIRWAEDGTVFMTGPAEIVFEGNYNLDASANPASVL